MKNAGVIIDITAYSRERYAKELFDPDRIATVIEGRAMEGYRDLRVHQDYPFDLTESPSAKKLETWLEANKFRYAWLSTPPPPDPRYPVPFFIYPELVICW